MSNDLYQVAMIETARRASGRGRLAKADASAIVDNPLCGDRVIVDIRTEEISSCGPSSPVRLRRIVEIGHEVRGCLLCEAAAVVLAERTQRHEIESLFGLHRAIESALRSGSAFPWPTLDIFSPVAATRSRHRCITLPFEALHEVLTMVVPAAETLDSRR